MKPRIDPGSRVVLEEAPPLPHPPSSSTSSDFVELCARTTFSGVTIEGFGVVEGTSTLDARAAWPGAGLPKEVVARVGIADVDTISGVVRAPTLLAASKACASSPAANCCSTRDRLCCCG